MNEVVTVRPSSLSIAPLFQSSVSESPSNIFYQKVLSQSADARRMSFVWRSPGAQLLLSPSATLQFTLKVTVPHFISKAMNVASVAQRQNVRPPIANGSAAFTGENTVVGQKAYGAGLAFGQGNAVMNAVESIQYVINGGSISHSNWNLFKRTLDSCYIPAKVAQRCFSQSGGSFNRYDETATSSSISAGRGGGTAAQSDGQQYAGMTMDSGLQMRLRNFSDAIVGQAD